MCNQVKIPEMFGTIGEIDLGNKIKSPVTDAVIFGKLVCYEDDISNQWRKKRVINNVRKICQHFGKNNPAT